MDVIFNVHRYIVVNSYIVYSFVLSKKDELKLIAEQIKINGITPLVSQRKCFVTSYIRRLVEINKKVLGYCSYLSLWIYFVGVECAYHLYLIIQPYSGC